MQEQNFKNHGRMVTGFHFVLFGILLFVLVCSLWNIYYEVKNSESLLEALMFSLITVAIILNAWYSRVFALKAQDRAIRAEENFRHFMITGEPLNSALKMSQIIALRFASDGEMANLAKKAVAENLSNKAIKQEIKNWKADHNRA
jgi:Family of unknown function (DUF6526)